MLQFLDAQVDSTSTCLGEPLDKQTTAFLDVGTGNGSMLFALRGGGWGGEMVGVDYSAKSVELARRVGREMGYGSGSGKGRALERGPGKGEGGGEEEGEAEGAGDGEDGNKEVRFEIYDIMASSPPSPTSTPWLPPTGFDVVLDKGTFDAISLSSDLDDRGRRICESYRERVERLVKRGGVLLVTSCNWTEEELKTWFVVPEGDGELEAVGRIRYPVFRFGGGVGQSVSCVCFRRREG